MAQAAKSTRKSAYRNFAVTDRNGVTRIFFDKDDDVRETAHFYVPSFGPVVQVRPA